MGIEHGYMPDYPEKSVLLHIITSIVDYPEAVAVERSSDEQGVLLTLSVDKADMGKVIGKEGNMSRSIRTILRVIGIRQGAAVSLKILEPLVPHTHEQ